MKFQSHTHTPHHNRLKQKILFNVHSNYGVNVNEDIYKEIFPLKSPEEQK